MRSFRIGPTKLAKMMQNSHSLIDFTHIRFRIGRELSVLGDEQIK